MKIVIFIIVLLFNFLTLFSQTEEDEFVKSLRQIRTNITSFTCRGCQTAQDSMINIINGTLMKIHQSDIKIKPPQKYQMAMHSLNLFAEEMAKKENRDKSADMQLLLRDFKLKFQNSPDYFSTQSILKLVKVEVAVKDGTKTINDLSVHYCCLGEKPNYTNPINTFQTLTSPASESLPPGVYRIWISKGGNNTVLKQTVSDVDPLKTNKIILYVGQ